ncbi:hypothetical protein [Streptomyces sp. NPDC059861]
MSAPRGAAPGCLLGRPEHQLGGLMLHSQPSYQPRTHAVPPGHPLTAEA